MKRLFYLLLVASELFGGSTVESRGEFIYINLSYKVVLNPVDGTRPPGVTNANIHAAIESMNEFLATYARGYRMRLTEPIREVGGQNDATGPSQWYGIDFLNHPDGAFLKFLMQSNAIYNPGPYAWNDHAINIYINQAAGGGISSFPSQIFFSDDHIVILGAGSYTNAARTLHELGHYFNLCHTHGCGSPFNCCSDDVSDTIEDEPCWQQDNIAKNHFGWPWAGLSLSEKQIVDDVFFNIMSYRGATCGTNEIRSRLTEGQLDRWTNAANFDREHVTTGRMWFVDTEGTLPSWGDWWRNSSILAFWKASDAIRYADAARGDIVLLRPGNYDETLRIDKRVTLRATRAGPATIGR